MFDEASHAAIVSIARANKIEPAALLAVVEVESAGQAFATVDGKREPIIRWEGHYFDRRLAGEKRERARRAGLASPKAGAVANPKWQGARWDLLRRAAGIDETAAYESASYGAPQIMGAHWKALKYRSVKAFIAAMRKGYPEQIDAMMRFIKGNDLLDELERLDFTGFARGWNGPGFRKNAYHIKMAAAYRRWSNGAQPVSKAKGMLRMGSRGAKVRELQALLVRAGYVVETDGEFGTATKAALKAFQKANRIAVDGVAGPHTMRALESFRQAPEEVPGAAPVEQIPEVKEGAGGVAGGAALETVSTQVEQAADKVSWLPGLEWLSATLTTIAVLLVLGGLAWAAYGWWKARQTDEGDVGGPGLLERVKGFFRRRQEEVMP